MRGAAELQGARGHDWVRAELQRICLFKQHLHVRLLFVMISQPVLTWLSRWANVTVGLPCIVQNTAYTAYGPDGEFIDIVSRQVLPLLCRAAHKSLHQCRPTPANILE